MRFSLLYILLGYANSLIVSYRNLPTILCGRRNKNAFMWDEEVEDEYYYGEKNTQSFKELFIPKSENQILYYDAINDPQKKLVVADGPAGCGKTLLSTQYVAKILYETNKKVILTRPLICVDEELGYLPGDINQKMDPWIIPIFDVLREFFSQNTIDAFIASKRLEIAPMAYMRGRTFKNSVIIGDELQNTSINQMLMLLTRIGEDSKMIISGDINQCDHTENGLKDFIERYRRTSHELIEYIKLESSDVQRSELISIILKLYDI